MEGANSAACLQMLTGLYRIEPGELVGRSIDFAKPGRVMEESKDSWGTKIVTPSQRLKAYDRPNAYAQD